MVLQREHTAAEDDWRAAAESSSRELEAAKGEIDSLRRRHNDSAAKDASRLADSEAEIQRLRSRVREEAQLEVQARY